jgi:hypothetical protein
MPPFMADMSPHPISSLKSQFIFHKNYASNRFLLAFLVLDLHILDFSILDFLGWTIGLCILAIPS